MLLKMFDLYIRVNGDVFKDNPDFITPFICEDGNKADFTYNYCLEEKEDIQKRLNKCKDYSVIKNEDKIKVFENEGKVYIYKKYILSSSEYGTLCVTDMSGDCADIFMEEGFKNFNDFSEISLSLMYLDYMILFKKRMVMHGAVAIYDGEAIIFTGPSGIGKSTQSSMWENELGAFILNGDRATLSFEDDEIYVYGSPYAGSSDIYINDRAKLKAIVYLGWGDKNFGYKMPDKLAFKSLIPRVSIPDIDKHSINFAMDYIYRLVNEKPIYSYDCLPDSSAVYYLKDLIWKI